MPRRTTPSFIYIVCAESPEHGYRAYKVGIASDKSADWRSDPEEIVASRLSGLQTGCPMPIRLVNAFNADILAVSFGYDMSKWCPADQHKRAAMFAEGKIHEYLKADALRGEWFFGPTIDRLVTTAEKQADDGPTSATFRVIELMGSKPVHDLVNKSGMLKIERGIHFRSSRV